MAVATFFLRCLKHFENGEISSASKLLKLTGGQFWVERNTSRHKKPHFLTLFGIPPLTVFAKYLNNGLANLQETLSYFFQITDV